MRRTAANKAVAVAGLRPFTQIARWQLRKHAERYLQYSSPPMDVQKEG